MQDIMMDPIGHHCGFIHHSMSWQHHASFPLIHPSVSWQGHPAFPSLAYSHTDIVIMSPTNIALVSYLISSQKSSSLASYKWSVSSIDIAASHTQKPTSRCDDRRRDRWSAISSTVFTHWVAGRTKVFRIRLSCERHETQTLLPVESGMVLKLFSIIFWKYWL